MGNFYKIEQVHAKNLLAILSESNVSGAEAHKVVAIGEILASKGVTSPSGAFYQFDDNLSSFIRKMLDQILIKGAFALQVVQIQLIFREGLDEIPKAVSVATPNPPQNK